MKRTLSWVDDNNCKIIVSTDMRTYIVYTYTPLNGGKGIIIKNDFNSIEWQECQMEEELYRFCISNNTYCIRNIEEWRYKDVKNVAILNKIRTNIPI